MIEIAVGTKNPTKLKAVENAIAELKLAKALVEPAHIKSIPVESGVSNQPMSDEEMIEGAVNRARAAAKKMPEAKYSIGMEGGIRIVGAIWFNLGWVCVRDTDSGPEGLAATVSHELPNIVSETMRLEDLELSDAITKVYGTDTINDRDCSGVITNGLLPADRLYASGVISAYAALKNNSLASNFL